MRFSRLIVTGSFSLFALAQTPLLLAHEKKDDPPAD